MVSIRLTWPSVSGTGVLVLRAAYPVIERPLPGRWLALAALVTADLGLIVVFAGGVTAPVDAVAPLTGHLLGLGLAAGIALLVRRKVVALVMLGVAATIGLHAWLGLARCCTPQAPSSEGRLLQNTAYGAERNLTVLSLNNWRSHPDLGRLRAYLATAPADVVVLSAFAGSRDMLEGLRPIYPYQVHCASELGCSLALLSRTAFATSGAARMGSGKPAFVWARLPGSLTIIGTHLRNPTLDPWLHHEQVDALAEFVRSIDGPLVLTGDLNTTPWSNAFRLLRADADLSPARLLMPTWPAWPVALPQIALDHIFVSADLVVTAAGTGPAVGSDHLPVWAHLQRPATYLQRMPRRRLALGSLAAPRSHLGSELLADLSRE
jgi:endonuclease/exonuclease/phosphatase (EEP) superfamily protein YafD